GWGGEAVELVTHELAGQIGGGAIRRHAGAPLAAGSASLAPRCAADCLCRRAGRACPGWGGPGGGPRRGGGAPGGGRPGAASGGCARRAVARVWAAANHLSYQSVRRASNASQDILAQILVLEQLGEPAAHEVRVDRDGLAGEGGGIEGDVFEHLLDDGVQTA